MADAGRRHTAPLTTRDVLRYATMNGAKALQLDKKTGSLTPGKEADIIILDATRINVAPLNQVPGAVVSLMDRTNVETVIVAGKVRKWKGRLLDVDLDSCAGSSKPRATTSSPRRASSRICSAATDAAQQRAKTRFRLALARERVRAALATISPKTCLSGYRRANSLTRFRRLPRFRSGQPR